jgi:hypothetical protein
LEPSKTARLEAAPLEPLSAAARAEIVPPEFLLKQLIAVDEADANLHVRFGRVSSTPFVHWLERIGSLLDSSRTWDASLQH